MARTGIARVGLSVVALTLVGCSASIDIEPDGLPDAPIPQLTWGDCREGSAGPSVDMSGFRCATVKVPLDYSEPGGKTIDLAVVQRPAADPANRIGTLFFNPGGPGGAGTVQFPQWADFFPDDIRAKFDIVSWDPRGIGSSTATQCFDSEAAESEVVGAVDAFPATDADVAAYKAAFTTVAEHCANRAGDLLQYVSTADTARDLDSLRKAVGDDKLTYWGVSYGSYLGATYVNLFPDTVRAVVLDGNIDPLAWTNDGKRDATQSLTGRIGSDVATHAAIGEFLRQCGSAGPQACAFAAESPDATVQKWSTLLDRLRVQPLILGAKTITYPDLVSQVDGAMDFVYAVNGLPGWSTTAAALQQLWDASLQPAAVAPDPADTPAAEPGPYTGPEQTWGVECGDSPMPASDAWPGLVDEAAHEAGDSARDLLWADFVCSVWKVRAKLPFTGPWDAATTATVLVANNTHDNSTPYQNAEAMAKRLHSAQLLSVDGYGHTVLLNPSTCANNYITAYLLDGTTLPPEGTTCKPDATPFG